MFEGSSFPVRLFRWFLSRQILFSGFLIILLNGVMLIVLERGGYEPQTLELARAVLLISLATASFVTIAVSLWVAWRLVVPLGRLIEKTKRLREFPFASEDEEPEALTFEEPGEWFELERALNRLGRDLRQKTIRLSREKTELRTIMSAVTEAILAISNDRRILFFNPQVALLFNLKPSDGDRRFSEILREPDVLEAYYEVLRTGVPTLREVQLTSGVDRANRHMQLSVAPLRKKHNQEIYGVVGIFHDITELKKAERIRIEFVGNVSHELRTPLTTVSGYLQTAIDDMNAGRKESAEEFLQVVSRNVGRMKDLVEDLLDLSALESGKELNLQAVPTRDLTEAVLSQIESRAHRIQIFYGLDQLWGDPMRVEQVLRNLLENAVRYVPVGKNIEVRWVKTDSGVCELHVKDDGPGIAPEDQARLFERFYRVGESRARTDGGTGIGLSLVKHIMHRHGGQAVVRSQLGKGAEFICSFPAGPV